ncbi:MAG: DUF935 family protein [Luteolibacter sp.]
MSGCRPVGSALPARRDSAVAAAATTPTRSGPLGSSIIVEVARDRLYDFYERQMMPSDVKGILQATLSGDLTLWQRLYQAMLDSWPMLQKCLAELQREVRNAPWKCRPYCVDGGTPDENSEESSTRAHAMLWGARPRPAYAEGGLEDLMDWLVAGYFTGISVTEPRWENIRGEWRPMAYHPVPARYYGYRGWGPEEDRLMLSPEGGVTQDFQDFPDHRFLIAIHGGHPSHPLVSAPLRVLTGWWLAAVYGLEWFMKYAQLFGVPFRWATYADDSAKEGLAEMMANLGNAGWGVAKQGTTLDFPQNSTTAQSLPQAELLKLADEQCQQFMLGQTLTSGVSKDGGSRALGDVHADTKHGVVRGIADYVGGILTRQLIPAWAYWNAGTVPDQLPEFFPDWSEPKDLKTEAERMDILINKIRLPMEVDDVYEALGIAKPAEGAALFQPLADDGPGKPAPHANSIAASYRPDQKRSPKGSREGGRWVDEHGGGSSSSSSHHDVDPYRPPASTTPHPEKESVRNRRIKREEKAAVRESRKRIPAAKDLLRSLDLEDLDIQPRTDGFSFGATERGGRQNEIHGYLSDGILKISSMFPGDNPSETGMTTRAASLALMKQIIEGAEAAGIRKIVTTGGRGGEEKMTGYFTWPYVGFDLADSEIQKFKEQLPDNLLSIATGETAIVKKERKTKDKNNKKKDPKPQEDPEAREKPQITRPSLRTLVQDVEGNRWWRENGYSVRLEFDLQKKIDENGDPVDSDSVKRFHAFTEDLKKTKAYQSYVESPDDHNDTVLIRAMEEIHAGYDDL